MKHRYTLIALLVMLAFSSCKPLLNWKEYKTKTAAFSDAMLRGDVARCKQLCAPNLQDMPDSVFRASLSKTAHLIDTYWGTHLNYTFTKANKQWSTGSMYSTPPNTTQTFIQFDNGKYFGVYRVLFDDKTGRIADFTIMDIKYPVPSMAKFWMLIPIGLCIVAFDIYVIVKIKRSKLRRKWLKYIAVALLNFPSFTYNPFTGFGFKLSTHLFGFSYSQMGYLETAMSFAIPVAGIYWLWKLKRRKDRGDDEWEQIVHKHTVQDEAQEESISAVRSQNTRYEILEHLPSDGPMPVNISDRQHFYSEGFVVRFYKTDGSNWIANFNTGSSDFSGVFNMPGRKEFLVIAWGAAIIVDPDNEEHICFIPGEYSQLFYTSKERIVLQDATTFTIVEPDLSFWHTGRISWDGFSEVKVEGSMITGIAYQPYGAEKHPFTYNIDSREVEGGIKFPN